jgi:tellurite resistance protein TerB
MPILKELIDSIHHVLEKHNNRTFLEATMAACAIVAKADGIVNFAERGRLDQIVNLIERLKLYGPHEAIDLFNEYVENHDVPYLLEKIQKIMDRKSDQQIILKICWDICRIDGEINRLERDAIEMIAHKLGLNFREMFKEF